MNEPFYNGQEQVLCTVSSLAITLWIIKLVLSQRATMKKKILKRLNNIKPVEPSDCTDLPQGLQGHPLVHLLITYHVPSTVLDAGKGTC